MIVFMLTVVVEDDRDSFPRVADLVTTEKQPALILRVIELIIETDAKV
jgi:hypothetical protein